MISKEIINSVLKNYTRAGKVSAKKITDYLSKNEPAFKKYLETTTYDDIRSLVEKLSIPPTKIVLDILSNIINTGKIEGFFIHSFAQDEFWKGKYGIDTSGNLKTEEKFKLFLDGKLDAKYYDYELTEEEKNDSKNFKKIAKDNFKKHQFLLNIENTSKREELNTKSKIINKNKKDVLVTGDLLD